MKEVKCFVKKFLLVVNSKGSNWGLRNNEIYVLQKSALTWKNFSSGKDEWYISYFLIV